MLNAADPPNFDQHETDVGETGDNWTFYNVTLYYKTSCKSLGLYNEQNALYT